MYLKGKNNAFLFQIVLCASSSIVYAFADANFYHRTRSEVDEDL